MAQDYGGKNHASPRYINTELNPITRFLFPEIDNKLLNYLNEDGISVAPEQSIS
ncbi:DNA topoisomerase 2 [Orobanche gracilis]